MKTDWRIKKQDFQISLLDTPSRATTTYTRQKSIVSGVLSQLKSCAKLMNMEESEIYAKTDGELKELYKQFKIEIKGEEKYFYPYQLALRKYLRFCNINIDPVKKMTGRQKSKASPSEPTFKNLTPINSMSEEGVKQLSIRAFQTKSGAVYLKIG